MQYSRHTLKPLFDLPSHPNPHHSQQDLRRRQQSLQPAPQHHFKLLLVCLSEPCPFFLLAIAKSPYPSMTCILPDDARYIEIKEFFFFFTYITLMII